MNWLDAKYIGLLSSRFRNFKRKSPTLWNFSCIFCGDSETDKRKARGYIYEKSGKTLFHCHNCDQTQLFSNFLKSIDFQLHSQYLIEKLQDNKSPKQIDLEQFVKKLTKPVFQSIGPLKDLKKVSQLKADHPCKIFVVKRQIPNPYHAKMFFCPKFFKFSNELVPGKFDEQSLNYDEPRLLIPFFDSNGNMHAFQGRALNNNRTKYITIVTDQSVPKVYGLDTVNFDKKVYCFEGPLDSIFVPNSIATAGGDIISTISQFPKKNITIVYDNEPRSINTKKKIEKAIFNGYNVCIWPSNLEHKDTNDMAISGMSSDFIKHIIDTNTYSDLKAKLALNAWSKT